MIIRLVTAILLSYLLAGCSSQAIKKPSVIEPSSEVAIDQSATAFSSEALHSLGESYLFETKVRAGSL